MLIFYVKNQWNASENIIRNFCVGFVATVLYIVLCYVIPLTILGKLRPLFAETYIIYTELFG